MPNPIVNNGLRVGWRTVGYAGNIQRLALDEQTR